ncbi:MULTISPECIES: tyrosine-type recombinase/integrase [unclassified Lysinibacillus]|uniref:tyrosine-type recombinase/integrase n=1 Tax=unclassified Lysinibacillus TaxID=2636778 RepID=UPI0038035EE3
MKTAILPKLSETNIINAITQFEKSLGSAQQYFSKTKKLTFKSFSEHFMNDYVNVNLKVKSRNTDENYLKQGVLEFFGIILLHKITPTQINLFFVQQKKVEAGSIEEKFMLLNTIFNKAIEWGHIEVNPCAKATKPKRSKLKRINYYTEQQMQQLLSILPKLYIKHQLQIKIAMYCGLRMSKITGLRFHSFDFDNNTIYVDRILQYDKEQQRFFLDSTKTGENRLVYAPESLMNELQTYIEIKQKKLSKLGDRFNPILDKDGNPIYLMFSKDNGFPNHPDRMSKQWQDIVRQFPLPSITFHGLRHTFASYMLSKGVNIKVIQEQLGHATIHETLNTYSHVAQDQKERSYGAF